MTTTCTVEIQSMSVYSSSRAHETPRLEGESADAYERRTWREKLHYNPKTLAVFLPAMGFRNGLMESAQFLGLRIAGKGQATWTKHFTAGILVPAHLELAIKRDDVEGEWFLCHVNGRRGSGSRVSRCFPMLYDWGGRLEFVIIDPTITEDIFRYHLETAGRLIGVGRFRPRNGGTNGRFSVTRLTWQET